MALLKELGSAAFQAIAEQYVRADGWFNTVTGLGTAAADKSMSTEFTPSVPLRPEFTSELYQGDPIAARIANARPKGALRRGILTTDASVTADFVRLRCADIVAHGLGAGLATGCAIVVPITGDPSPEKPRAPGTPLKPIERLDMFDRLQLENDRTSGIPKDTFRVSPLDGPQFLIHKSRCLVFGGVPTLHRKKYENNGWDLSIFDSILAALRKFNDGYLNLGHMVGDASQGVLTIKGLMAQLGQTGGKDRMAARAQLMAFFRAVNRTMILDADGNETYTKVATSWAGLPDVIDRFANYLSAVTGIPVTVIMGQAPAGLNATGDSDIRLWYDEVKTYQQSEVAPALNSLADMIKPGTTVAFPELYQLTDKEKAEVELLRAQKHKLWVDMMAVYPEEIARAIADGKEPIPVMSERLPATVQDQPDPAELPALPAATPESAESKITITPSDQTIITTVAKALESLGMDPMTFGPDDAKLTMLEFKAKRGALVAAAAAAEAGTDPNAPPAAPATPAPVQVAPPEALTVNEIRAKDGKTELRKDGEKDPDGDLPFVEYQAKHRRVVRVGLKEKV